jgi:RNA recognition motif-containing protein
MRHFRPSSARPHGRNYQNNASPAPFDGHSPDDSYDEGARENLCEFNWMHSSRGKRKGSDEYGEVRVGNLHYDVSEQDLQCLFESVGQVLAVHIDYDRSGRSNGTAVLTLGQQADAVAAVERFQNVLLDGRPMHIQLPSVVESERRIEICSNSQVRQSSHHASYAEPIYNHRGHSHGRRYHHPHANPKTSLQDERQRLDRDLDVYMSERKKGLPKK